MCPSANLSAALCLCLAAAAAETAKWRHLANAVKRTTNLYSSSLVCLLAAAESWIWWSFARFLLVLMLDEPVLVSVARYQQLLNGFILVDGILVAVRWLKTLYCDDALQTQQTASDLWGTSEDHWTGIQACWQEPRPVCHYWGRDHLHHTAAQRQRA